MNKITLLVLLTCAIAGPAWAGTVSSSQINYQGVLRDANDKPLDGTFDMVFRFWSDETGGDEIMIDTHAGVVVSHGLFSVRLGGGGSGGTPEGVISDGSGPGEYAFLPNVFRDYAVLYLEVEVEGEVLAPRSPVVATGQSMNTRFVNGVDVALDSGLELYVDAVNGDDDNNGIWPYAPKRTIQAALDRTPYVLGGDVTIHVADGTYHEAVWIDRRLHKRFNRIRLIGNETAPQNVILDGEGTLADGMLVLDLVEIGGFTFTGYLEQGVEAFETLVVVHDCVFTGNGLSAQAKEAAVAAGGSTIQLADTVISGNQAYGIEAFGAKIELENVTISGNGNHGIYARQQSMVQADGGVSITNNGGWGAWAQQNSCVDFRQHADAVVTGNALGDLTPRNLSSIVQYGAGTTGACVTVDAYSFCDP